MVPRARIGIDLESLREDFPCGGEPGRENPAEPRAAILVEEPAGISRLARGNI